MRSMFKTNGSKSLKMCGVLVLALALWAGCSDDEGTKKKKEPEKKTPPKKKTVPRKAQKIYLWARTNSHNGQLGDNRAAVDGFCTGAAATAAGKPARITPANYVTKTLVLSNPINNFLALGTAAVAGGAHKESLTDPVYGLSGDEATETRLASNYGTLTSAVWAEDLQDANVGDTGTNDQLYWIGIDSNANTGTKHSTQFHCNNFNSNTNGAAVMGGSDVDQGTYLLSSSPSAIGGGGAAVSPLLASAGVHGCNRTLYFLCISFPRK